ncbi:MAG: hypothetical protein A2W93_04640 [Bacteroidetes bacterium GWF2_43_63]|nr:MAG: hypothetical protein A2W94_12630 [Bacteroidetes bacterium GWE2_42_42]OFY56099.1 MAG: hypothetical protein A2W93_04640 [Bacteroidetes bacterium GWF2_43_63]
MLVFAFSVALIVSWATIPPIVALSNAKKLFEEPNERSAHKIATPTLGGLAIFAGFKFSYLVFSGNEPLPERPFIAAGCLVIFLMGMKDDIFVLAPIKKFLAQIFATLLVVILGNLFISDFQGLFGIHEIPYWFSVLFSFFVVIAIINAFNLSDGIDGLAGSLGNIAAITLGSWFALVGDYVYAIMCFSLAGAIIGFLRYNLSNGKNKIFMGDTGSLLIGFVIAVATIRFIELNRLLSNEHHIYSAPGVAIGILFIPIYDTIRVMTARILRKQSPFKADRGHLHHKLLDLGYSHPQATLIISVASIIFIVLAFILQHLGSLKIILILTVIATIWYLIPVTKWARRISGKVTGRSEVHDAK